VKETFMTVLSLL